MAAPLLPPQVAASTADLLRLRHGARDLTFFPRMAAGTNLAGNRSSRYRGRGMDFDEVRPYQAGDDIRSIDWRVTARTYAPHTKVFREERERPLVVVVDLREGMFFGSRKLKSVTACEVAATLAWAGLNAGDRVGGLVFGPDGHRDVRLRRGDQTVLQLIHTLSETSVALHDKRPCHQTLGEMLEDTRRVAHPGSTVAIISDFHDFDSRCERHLFDLARHTDITLCQVYDAIERELPAPGWYAINSASGRLSVNTGNSALRERFAQRFRDREARLQQLARRQRINFLQIASDESVLAKLQSIYGKRHGRR